MFQKGKQRKAPATRHQLSCDADEITAQIEDPDDQPQASCSSAQIATNEHSYSITSPRKLKHKLHNALDAINTCKKKLKTDQQRVRRLRKKVESLTAIVEDIQKQNFLSSSGAEVLDLRNPIGTDETATHQR